MLPRHLPTSLRRGTQDAERLPNVWGALLLAPVLVFFPTVVVQLVLVVVIAPLVGSDVEMPLDLLAQALVLLCFSGVWLALWVWLRRYEKRPLASIGLVSSRPVRHLLGGLLVAAGIIGLSVAVVATVGGARLELSPTLLLPALLSLIGWSVQASAEEAVFRGWLFPVLSVKRSPTFGLVVSSLLFALLHGANLGFSPVAFVNIFLVGLLFGIYVMLQGDLWGAIGLHIAFNWLQGNILGLPTSGITLQATLFQTSFQGPVLLTGGTFGLEGSLVMTLMLLVALGIAVWWLRENGAKQS